MTSREENLAPGLDEPDAICAWRPLQPSEAVFRAVHEGSEADRVYWLMNALATVIACYGLLANSLAVVMAPWPWPIAGVALGLSLLKAWFPVVSRRSNEIGLT